MIDNERTTRSAVTNSTLFLTFVFYISEPRVVADDVHPSHLAPAHRTPQSTGRRRSRAGIRLRLLCNLRALDCSARSRAHRSAESLADALGAALVRNR